MDFLKDHWIAILSLIVALIGGIPGIIAIINHQKNRPDFEFMQVNLITGSRASQEHTENPTMILLTGTVSNKGNSVLTPAHYELKAKIDGVWVQFEKTLIPENAIFGSEVDEYRFDPPPWKRDLQLFNRSISTGMPVYGHLMFISHDVSLERLRDSSDLEMRLICVDVFNKRHETDIKQELNATKRTKRGRVYPKHGLEIRPKK